MNRNKILKGASVLLIVATLILFSTASMANTEETQNLNKLSTNPDSPYMPQEKIPRDPAFMSDRGWVYYHTGYSGNAVGLTAGGTYEAAIKLTPDELNPAYCNCIITNVKFYHHVQVGTTPYHNCTMNIYDEGTPSEPGALIYSNNFVANGEGWIYVTLCEPVLIDCTQDYWVSIEVHHAAGEYPLGVDSGPAVDAKGDWVYFDPGPWEELQDLGLDYNWCIEAYIDCGEEDHKMHYPQYPDPNGWDVDFHDWMLGDDWECSETGPVNDIHFWISWLGDHVHDIPWIKVSIYTDQPGPPYSRPKDLKWTRTFDEGQFTVEGPWDGDQGWYFPPEWWLHDHELYWKINIDCIDDPFYQEACNIYWLVIEMPFYYPDGVGWKTSKDHFMDNAVFGWHPDWYPLIDPITQEPLDFAFIITREPDPAICCKGTLNWVDVPAGKTVTGTFDVENCGETCSTLKWKVVDWPTWGTSWTFTPSSGVLSSGASVTVTASVTAPNVEDADYYGNVTVCNEDDPSDCCIIPVTLKTPKIKLFIGNPLLRLVLERLSQYFPMFEQLL
jgi:hypothetical protein